MYWWLHKKDSRLSSENEVCNVCNRASWFNKPIMEHLGPKNHVTCSLKAMEQDAGVEMMDTWNPSTPTTYSSSSLYQDPTSSTSTQRSGGLSMSPQYGGCAFFYLCQLLREASSTYICTRERALLAYKKRGAKRGHNSTD